MHQRIPVLTSAATATRDRIGGSARSLALIRGRGGLACQWCQCVGKCRAEGTGVSREIRWAQAARRASVRVGRRRETDAPDVSIEVAERDLPAASSAHWTRTSAAQPARAPGNAPSSKRRRPSRSVSSASSARTVLEARIDWASGSGSGAVMRVGRAGTSPVVTRRVRSPGGSQPAEHMAIRGADRIPAGLPWRAQRIELGGGMVGRVDGRTARRGFALEPVLSAIEPLPREAGAALQNLAQPRAHCAQPVQHVADRGPLIAAGVAARASATRSGREIGLVTDRGHRGTFTAAIAADLLEIERREIVLGAPAPHHTSHRL